MFNTISLILNALLSSGPIVTLITIKSVKSKAKSEAKGAEIDNAKKLLDNFDTFIVQPLKSEVKDLRTSIHKLQLAIKQIPSCPHADNCPVSAKLNDLRDNNQTIKP